MINNNNINDNKYNLVVGVWVEQFKLNPQKCYRFGDKRELFYYAIVLFDVFCLWAYINSID